MSIATRSKSFGRRSPGERLERSNLSAPVAATGEADIEDLARRIGLRSGDADLCLRAAPSARVVPWSARAALLAGLATSFLAAGALLVNGGQQGLDPKTASSLTALTGWDPSAAGPALLFVALLSGGRATFWTLLVAHSALKRGHATSFLAYGSVSAVVAIATLLLSQILGLGADQDPVTGIALAACAGMFYRLFAGAQPAKSTEPSPSQRL